MNRLLIAFLGIFNCGMAFGMIKTLSEVDEAFIIACAEGQEQAAKFLLTSGADKDLLTSDGSTPLCIAAQNGHFKVAQMLLAERVDVNKTGTGATALYRASEGGYYDLVNLLMRAGADKSLAFQGMTPLKVATKMGHIAIIQLLLNSKNRSLMANTTSVPFEAKFCDEQGPRLDGGRRVSASLEESASASLEVPRRAESHSHRQKNETVRLSSAAAIYFPKNVCIGEDIGKCTVKEHRKHAAAVTNSERKEKVSKVDHHISRGNEYFAASKWCRALEHYIRALDKVERESEAYYSIVFKLMQVCRITKDGAEVVKNARILESQNKYLGMKSLALCVLAECAYQGSGLPRDLNTALKYAQDAASYAETSTDPDNQEAREQASGLIKKIIEELVQVREMGELGRRFAEQQEKKQINAPKTAMRPNDLGGVLEAESLWKAAEEGRVEQVAWLLQAGVERDKVNAKGATPLFIASRNGHAGVVQLLLGAHVDTEKAMVDGTTPLYIASQNGHAEVVQLLLDAQADKDRAMTDGATPLFIASQKGHTYVVQLLLEAGADKQLMNSNGATPLAMAAGKGHAQVVRLLLAWGGDMDKGSEDGITPLIAASHSGHNEVVQVLLEAGADKEKAMADGTTPLFVASMSGHADVVKLLLQARVDRDKAQSQGVTPLFVASQEGHANVVQLLLDARADKDKANASGATPLFIASQRGHANVVKLLLKAGASRKKSWKGQTPLDVAIEKGHTEIVRLLKSATY